MIRIPPSLSYLTIYNPTLRPSEPSEDDEDAEEQAHILFYTSKDRAVSRDRMLRQVGLGKALVNFAGYKFHVFEIGYRFSDIRDADSLALVISVITFIHNQDGW